MGNVGPAVLTGILIQILMSASKGMKELQGERDLYRGGNSPEHLSVCSPVHLHST